MKREEKKNCNFHVQLKTSAIAMRWTNETNGSNENEALGTLIKKGSVKCAKGYKVQRGNRTREQKTNDVTEQYI